MRERSSGHVIWAEASCVLGRLTATVPNENQHFRVMVRVAVLGAGGLALCGNLRWLGQLGFVGLVVAWQAAWKGALHS